MAVYKKTYTPYSGSLTPGWSRFLVLPRFAFEEMYRSRFLTIFTYASFVWPLLCALGIYLNHNLSVLKILGIRTTQIFEIDAGFFMIFLGIQSMLAFFMAAFVGPGLVSPDVINNALPLYLARPFTRTEYVLGKGSVLLILLSVMTWVPGVMLWCLQSYMQGGAWAWNNLRIVGALFLGAWIWILLLTLMALAYSAWVKWRHLSAAFMFLTFFFGAGFGAAINGVMRTKWGSLINVSHLIGSVWATLFAEESRRGLGAVFFRIAPAGETPIWTCWLALFAMYGFFLYLLALKIRGAEVVK